MQNEELHRVFNISDRQNHRYNGFVLPSTDDKNSNKVKKSSPKPKKITGLDMVTVSNKNCFKRRSRVKNSLPKSRDSVIVNGVNSVNSILPKKEFNSLADKYRSTSVNNFNKNSEANDINSVESISSILSTLSNDLDSNLKSNNRLRLANPLKYTDVNHSRSSEATSSGVSYFKGVSQYSNTDGEFKLKTNHANNFSASKVNNSSLLGRNKFIDGRKKEDETSRYLPEISAYKSIAPNNSQFEECVIQKTDPRFESSKFVEKDTEKTASELNNRVCENKLFLRAKRRKPNRSKWQMDSGTRHEALQRIRNSVEMQENLQNDLFPLNIGETVYEKSDSDSSEEYSSTYQNNWFHSMAEIEFDDVKRSFRLGQLYSELRRQWCQMKQNKSDLPMFTDKFMKSLVDTARTRPSDAARFLEEQESLQNSMVEPLILAKKKCTLENCKNVALPCMPTCVRHILHCEKQTLFEQCRVRDSNEFQCDKPVLNIKYHYAVCSLHSKSDFVLPDFSLEDIKYDDVRNKNNMSSSDIYKIDFDFSALSSAPPKPVTTPTSSKPEINKKRNHSSNSGKTAPNIRIFAPEKKEKGEKKIFEKETKSMINGELEHKPVTIENKEVIIKNEQKSVEVPNESQNLLRDWVSLSDSQLVDAKTLENTLQNEFVNGFDINASSIQSQIQDIINSESSLSTDMLMGSHELPNYIQVEEMIEEVEITDETLDSAELNNHELVHSEDLNAVLKQLPPEAFNELFSDKNDSHWGETQALERVIEEMDVRKCALIDPSLLLEDIEPSYSNYSNNYDSTGLTENLDTKFSDLTSGNCSQSQS